MVQSEGNMSLKNPVTQPGIDPGTVRPVAQRLNRYAIQARQYRNVQKDRDKKKDASFLQA